MHPWAGFDVAKYIVSRYMFVIERDNARVGKGSGLYGEDATGAWD